MIFAQLPLAGVMRVDLEKIEDDRGFFARSLIIGGSPSSLNVLILNGIILNAPATAPRCINTLALNLHNPLTPKERSSSFCSSNLCF